jgi:hypothetical protein
MEATISPGFRDTTASPPAPQPPVAAGATKYRQAIAFYRVASVQDAFLNPTDGQMYQVVNLEQPVTGYPITHSLGDARQLPDPYGAGTTFSGNVVIPTTIPNAGIQSVWVPVVIWHGLQEVFTVRN